MIEQIRSSTQGKNKETIPFLCYQYTATIMILEFVPLFLKYKISLIFTELPTPTKEFLIKGNNCNPIGIFMQSEIKYSKKTLNNGRFFEL